MPDFNFLLLHVQDHAASAALYNELLESKTAKLNRRASVGSDFLIHHAGRMEVGIRWASCSDDLRERVVAAMATGRSCRDVGSAFDVAPSTAGNWYRLHRRTNSHAARPMGGDRRSKLTEHAGWIAARLAQASELTSGEVRDELAGRGIPVSYASVWRMVRRLGLRHKKKDHLRH